MKLRFLTVFWVLTCLLTAEEAEPQPSFDSVMFDPGVWTRTLEDVFETGNEETEDAGDEVSEEVRERLAKQGISLDDGSPGGFSWLSARREGLRAAPGSFTLCGKPVGEIVVRGEDDQVSTVAISIYNRGDDGEMKLDEFTQAFRGWKRSLDEIIEARAEERNQTGTVAVEGWMWIEGDSAYLLESSWNKSEDRAEFIRLRSTSVSGAANQNTRVAKRRTLDSNVRKNDEGFTYVDGIPMVDQGEKGYCVVATVERVGLYMGVELDQHEMAQLADTTDEGTTGEGMEDAFSRLTGKIGARTLKLISYDDRRFERDVRKYNRAASRAGAWTFDVDLDRYIVHPAMFWSKAVPDIFREVKARQNRCDHFKRKIKEYVDQGIPLPWTLFLGMYKEEGLPQSWGGHMRLITGYNFDDPDHPKIYYTDSWGEGHERKVMHADEAYCMTLALYVMIPNQ